MYQKAFRLSAGREKNKIEIFLETLGGYYVYKDNLKVESENFHLKMQKDSQAFKGLDPITRKLKDFYKEQNIFLYETSLKDGAPAEVKDLVISLQACSKDNCLLPVKVLVPIEPMPAIHASQASDAPEISTESSLATKIKSIFKSSGGILSLQSLLILLLAGIITAISPCVLPLFPLTLGIFSRWAHKNSERAFGLTISYCCGIILFFAINGLISAATGGIFGALAQNPYYLLILGIIILIAGIIFSGVVPFPFANFLLQLAGTPDMSNEPQSYRRLLAKSFAMGATLGLVASPCVGPILLALLAWLSSELPQGDFKSYASGFIALSVFGLGLSLPFLIMGHFYFRLHKRLPLGRFSVIAKYAGSALLIGSSFFFLVPAYRIFTSSAAASEMKHTFNWENRPAGKWLVVDFRADWCAACLEIEKRVLTRPDVEEYFEKNNWALVSVDMTVPETHEKTAQMFDVISLPSLVFLNPDGKECKTLRLNELESSKNFLKRLAAAQAACN